MVRLGKSCGCAVLLILCFLFLAPVLFAQATPQSLSNVQPKRQAAPPQASASKAPSPQATTSQALKPQMPAKTATVHHRHKKAEPVADQPQTPPPPPTLAQEQPVAPQVTYTNGELAIQAPNSTLSQVLRAVQVRTGAAIDIPAGASSERVVANFGPGQPRDVLNALLNGSNFDYVILGVAGNPGAVQKVILTPRLAGTASAQNNPPPQQPAAAEPEESADTGGESEYPGGESQPEGPPHPGFRRSIPPGGYGPQDNPFDHGDPNVVKTPEQLMQELQQMQQQQQQYQEQLNPANRTAQPQ